MQTKPAVYVFAQGIDQSAAKDFALWSKGNTLGDIRIELNSQGGSILESLNLRAEINHIRRNGQKVTMAVMGRAASCAGWLLQSADHRVIDADSWILIHEVSSEVKGSRSAIKAELDRVDALMAQTYGILCSRTAGIEGGLTLEMCYEKTEGGKDWWIDAKTALALGLVDEIEYAPAFAAKTTSAA